MPMDDAYKEFLQELDNIIEKEQNKEDEQHTTVERLSKDFASSLEKSMPMNGGVLSSFVSNSIRKNAKQSRILKNSLLSIEEELQLKKEEFNLQIKQYHSAKERYEEGLTLYQTARQQLESYLHDAAIRFKATDMIAKLQQNVEKTEEFLEELELEMIQELHLKETREYEYQQLLGLLEQNKDRYGRVIQDRDSLLYQNQLNTSLLKKSTFEKQRESLDNLELKNMKLTLHHQKTERELFEKVVGDAKEERVKSMKRLTETVNKIRKQKEPLLEQEKKELERRTKAWDQLNQSIDGIKQRITLLHNKKLELKKLKEEKTKDTMNAIRFAGGNPFEILAEESLQVWKSSKEKEFLSTMNKRKDEIKRNIEKENEHNQRKHILEKQAAKERAAFNDKISKRTKEEEIALYLKSKTKNGVEIIDPLSKEKSLNASQLMNVKSWKFGLGTEESMDIWLMEEMKLRYPNAKPNEHAIPKADFILQTKKKATKVKDEDEESDEDLLEEDNEFKVKGYWNAI